MSENLKMGSAGESCARHQKTVSNKLRTQGWPGIVLSLSILKHVCNNKTKQGLKSFLNLSNVNYADYTQDKRVRGTKSRFDYKYNFTSLYYKRDTHNRISKRQ